VAAAAVDLNVEVQGDDIVVTLPGTSYVVYRAATFPQQLLTKSHLGREHHGAPMTQAEFHARAWKSASACLLLVGSAVLFPNENSVHLPAAGRRRMSDCGTAHS
jgi:hypothetical protein